MKFSISKIRFGEILITLEGIGGKYSKLSVSHYAWIGTGGLYKNDTMCSIDNVHYDEYHRPIIEGIDKV